MMNSASLARLEARYERLKEDLRGLGLIAHGTILERRIPRPRATAKDKPYGPYYQWTRKQHGRTRAVNLSASQAKAYAKAIQQHRKMEKLIEKMRDVSLKILDITTEGVKKRKPRKKTE
jgi:hypothetical protein